MFPAQSSQNVVLVGTKARIFAQLPVLRMRATQLVQSKRITLPGFLNRLERFQTQPPPSVANAPVLTDDYAPIEGLSGGSGK
jgi:hypothetical protein